MTHEKLVVFYTKRLETVKQMWKPSKYVLKERSEEYIQFAENELEVVKNGRTW